MNIRTIILACSFAVGTTCASAAEDMPATAGEALSGKHVIPAEAVRGHEAILVAGFSHDAGMQCGPWMKAIENDEGLKDASVYELAMLEKAPGMIRGLIKSGMRKGTTPEERDRIVVITQDQPRWEKFFGVEDSKEPYVLLLDANGNVVWRGHGSATVLEPQLRAALNR